MDFIFAKPLLVRTPANSFESYVRESQYHLDIAQFKMTMYLVSQVFYYRLEKAAFQVVNLNEKELVTLRKYINHYCFRPTPFGLFLGISLINWGDDDHKARHIKNSEF